MKILETSTRLYLTVIKHLLIENNLSNFVIDACIASNHLDLLITFLHQPIDIDLNQLYTKSNDDSLYNNRKFIIKINLKFLLELDTDVNFSDEEKRITLIYDVRQNNIDMVKLLLNKIYNPNDNLH
ncbi:unnamed protein product [Rotaria sp. Silwood1]|nr:unnamed protein product [Rotaria sp. Silwood1]CAF1530197.1 unnamed protein product [Rotaria sp. Silwood1]CAF3632818.1 unnamed protein product [Rotaria sp. Silwood1]CAF4659083.1 unnamed protein product [Rotaria sp. Silwood1]